MSEKSSKVTSVGVSNLFDEFWYLLVCYLDDLKQFLKIWIGFGLHKRFKSTDKEFWVILIRHYCASRNFDYEQFLKKNFKFAVEEGFPLVRHLFARKKCSRSGCYKFFTEFENTSSSCSYHSGKLKSNGCVSCCNGKGFQSPGCKLALHDGRFFVMLYMKREVETDENGKHELAASSGLPRIDRSTSNNNTIGRINSADENRHKVDRTVLPKLV